jgi:hypothetical protein
MRWGLACADGWWFNGEIATFHEKESDRDLRMRIDPSLSLILNRKTIKISLHVIVLSWAWALPLHLLSHYLLELIDRPPNSELKYHAFSIGFSYSRRILLNGLDPAPPKALSIISTECVGSLYVDYKHVLQNSKPVRERKATMRATYCRQNARRFGISMRERVGRKSLYSSCQQSIILFQAAS